MLLQIFCLRCSYPLYIFDKFCITFFLLLIVSIQKDKESLPWKKDRAVAVQTTFMDWLDLLLLFIFNSVGKTAAFFKASFKATLAVVLMSILCLPITLPIICLDYLYRKYLPHTDFFLPTRVEYLLMFFLGFLGLNMYVLACFLLCLQACNHIFRFLAQFSRQRRHSRRRCCRFCSKLLYIFVPLSRITEQFASKYGTKRFWLKLFRFFIKEGPIAASKKIFKIHWPNLKNRMYYYTFRLSYKVMVLEWKTRGCHLYRRPTKMFVYVFIVYVCIWT